MRESREPVELDDEDQLELEQVARLRKRYEDRLELIKTQAGQTEIEALVFLAWRGLSGCIVGSALAGAVLCSFFMPCFGTIGGFFMFGGAATLVGVFAAVIYVALRGRITIVTMMTWAGALVGMLGGLALFSSIPFANDYFLIMWSATCIGGLCSGTGSMLMARKRVRNYQITEGRGRRIWWQFEIKDLLIITTCLALTIVMLKLTDLLQYSLFGLAGLVASVVITWFVIQYDRFMNQRS